jgi:hypothetical protein
MSQPFPETILFARHLRPSLNHCIVNLGLGLLAARPKFTDLSPTIRPRARVTLLGLCTSGVIHSEGCHSPSANLAPSELLPLVEWNHACSLRGKGTLEVGKP